MSYLQKPPLGALPLYGHSLMPNVGLWLFNEGSGNKVFDLSGNGRTGTLTGTAPSWSSGKFGPAVLLPGTDEHILISPEIYQTTECTRIAWINSTAVGQEPVFGGDDVSDRSVFEIYTADKMGLYAYGLSTSGYHVSTSSVIAGKWHQVGYTYGGGTLQIIFDGVVENTVTGLTGNIGDIDFIGKYTGRYFGGQIDNVVIYNRALSASEIDLLYREHFFTFEREPIELWSAATQGGAPPAGIPILRRRRECA